MVPALHPLHLVPALPRGNANSLIANEVKQSRPSFVIPAQAGIQRLCFPLLLLLCASAFTVLHLPLSPHS